MKTASPGHLAWPALGMLMVASVGSIAQLSDSATFGWGAVTVYLLPALLFLLPVGLISAELATSNRGGIFVWVSDAFGERAGFQATWFVFMNSVTLYPVVAVVRRGGAGHGVRSSRSRVQRPLHGRGGAGRVLARDLRS